MKMAGSSLLECANLSKAFLEGEGRRRLVLDGVSFDVRQGQFVALLGPSGCGKTTLLRMIAGLTFPTSGRILINGTEVTSPGRQRAMVFQAFSLFPWLTVRQNAAWAARYAYGNTSERFALELLAKTGLIEFQSYYPFQLSGGMRQRLALVRTLVAAPEVLLLDEPLGSLDVVTREIIQADLRDLHLEMNSTSVLVTHDLYEALFLADKVILLSSAPARVLSQFDVDLPRKRGRETRTCRAFIEQESFVREVLWRESLHLSEHNQE